jgi:two-component system, NtrC family, sensor kinase
MKRIFSIISFYFPIRFKFLLVELLVVTSAIGVITVTMARLFHADKTAYIHDLTSTMALHTAEETHALLRSYQERLQVFARLMTEEGIPAERKSDMLKKLFQDFHEFVLIAEYDGGAEKNVVYDAKAFESAGVGKDELLQYHRSHPFPIDRIRKGEIFVDNSTISPKLPTMTLVIAEPGAERAATKVIAAVVRLDDLIKLAGRSRVFETFILDGNGILLGHADVHKVAKHLKPAGLPGVNDLKKGGGLVKTAEYSHDGAETVGGLALVELANLVTVVEIPKATAFLTAKTLLNSLLGVAFMLLMTSALLSFFWSSRLTRPIEMLSNATRVLGHGDFDIKVQPASRDEIGDLANSFNHMATELKDRDSALKVAQEQLVQSEKMAAFGQLGAGIAHEVKNPLAGILGFAQLSLRSVESGSPLHNNLATIEKETKRCKLIIDNLLKFARQEKVTYSPVDINTVVEDAAAIVDHQLGLNKVKLDKQLAPMLPAIFGNGNQIEQVLINMMINAQQAMEGRPGNIWLSTALIDDQKVQVRIKDDGPGIPREIQVKIFEPFFTTKAAGKGTGLGLSVSYGIIKDHKGDIELLSEVGVGTEFIITFPKAAFHELRQPKSSKEEPATQGAAAEEPAAGKERHAEGAEGKVVAEDAAAAVREAGKATGNAAEPGAANAPSQAAPSGEVPDGERQGQAAPLQRTPWPRSAAFASLEAEVAEAQPGAASTPATPPEPAAPAQADAAAAAPPVPVAAEENPAGTPQPLQRQPWRRPPLPYASMEEVLAEVKGDATQDSPRKPEPPSREAAAPEGGALDIGGVTSAPLEAEVAEGNSAGTSLPPQRQPWRRPALPFGSLEEVLAEVQAVPPAQAERTVHDSMDLHPSGKQRPTAAGGASTAPAPGAGEGAAAAPDHREIAAEAGEPSARG